MKAEPKVSIILPVYNVEKWIRETIESIKAQTLSDWEAIFVIDGSPDKSEEIVRNAMKNEPRIRILLQENQGQGAARDNGVANAKGDYLFFLDPDDLIPPNALEVSYNRAVETNADIVIGDYISFNDGDDIFPMPQNAGYKFMQMKERSPHTFGKKFIEENRDIYISINFMAACFKLFKKDFWLNHEITFPHGFKLGEDSTAMLIVFQHDPKISLINHSITYYRQRKNSSRSAKATPYNDIFKLYVFAINKLNDMNANKRSISTMQIIFFGWMYEYAACYVPLNEHVSFYEKMLSIIKTFDLQSLKEIDAKKREINTINGMQKKYAIGFLYFMLFVVARGKIAPSIKLAIKQIRHLFIERAKK